MHLALCLTSAVDLCITFFDHHGLIFLRYQMSSLCGHTREALCNRASLVTRRVGATVSLRRMSDSCVYELLIIDQLVQFVLVTGLARCEVEFRVF